MRDAGLLATSGLVLLAACGSVTGPGDADLHLTTAREAYTLPAEGPVRVAVTLANRGEAAAYVIPCRGPLTPTLDREVGGKWWTYGGEACPLVYSTAPIAVGPGESVTDTVRIARTGRFRLRLEAWSKPGGRERETIASNAFTIE